MVGTNPRSPALRAAFVLLALVAVVAPAFGGNCGDYRCVQEDRVYLGNARLFKTPCHVKADRVYRRISEYQEILDKGLTDRDVQYHLLMQKVTKRFGDAIKAMAREHKHDLVAEAGSVDKAKDDVPDVPDRTDEAIAALG